MSYICLPAYVFTVECQFRVEHSQNQTNSFTSRRTCLPFFPARFVKTEMFFHHFRKISVPSAIQNIKSFRFSWFQKLGPNDRNSKRKGIQQDHAEGSIPGWSRNFFSMEISLISLSMAHTIKWSLTKEDLSCLLWKCSWNAKYGTQALSQLGRSPRRRLKNSRVRQRQFLIWLYSIWHKSILIKIAVLHTVNVRSVQTLKLQYFLITSLLSATILQLLPRIHKK